MSVEWEITKLSDCASFQEGYVNPSQKHGNYFDGPVKWLRAVDLNNGYVNETTRTLTQEGFESAGKSALLFEPGTLAISKSGTIGRVGILQDYMCGNRAVINIKTNTENCDNRFIFYTLINNRALIENLAIGSVQKNLYTSALGKLEFNAPPIQIQREISRSLASLDNKIALNRQINQTLEQIAQAIFKSWFVDFEPTRAKMAAKEAGQDPERAAMAALSGGLLASDQAAAGTAPDATQATKTLEQLSPKQRAQLKALAALFPDTLVESELGEVPAGWEVSEIGKELDVVGGGTPSTKNDEFWVDGDIHWTSPKDLSDSSDKILLDTSRKVTPAGLAKISSGLLPINTVLLSSRAPVGYLAIAKIPVAVNQGYIAMKCEKKLTPEYVVQWAESVMDDIKQRASGTTFAEISKKNFKVISVLVPTERILREYSDLVSSLYEQITANMKSSATLENLRNTLLPKLLSGELSVSALEETP